MQYTRRASVPHSSARISSLLRLNSSAIFMARPMKLSGPATYRRVPIRDCSEDGPETRRAAAGVPAKVCTSPTAAPELRREAGALGAARRAPRTGHEQHPRVHQRPAAAASHFLEHPQQRGGAHAHAEHQVVAAAHIGLQRRIDGLALDAGDEHVQYTASRCVTATTAIAGDQHGVGPDAGALDDALAVHYVQILRHLVRERSPCPGCSAGRRTPER